MTLAAWFFIKPTPARLIASGRLQDGRDYAASCEMSTLSAFPRLGAKSYSIHSLDLTIDGKARAVPANAMKDITANNPKQRLFIRTSLVD